MINLDSIEEIKKIDESGVLQSIKLLPIQVEQVFLEFENSSVPKTCALAKNVVICGMGGSALGGRIVDSLIYDKARTPIEVFTEYKLPNYVNKDTLVIASSYSGNTEESVSALIQAIRLGAKVYIIATGGKLAKIAKDKRLAGYIFKAYNNPSGQPRLALGYSIAAILAVLAKCEFISLDRKETSDIINTLKKFVLEYGVDSLEDKNLAKKQAKRLKDKSVVLVASEHLVGSAHAFKNQLNETAKTFSVLFDIPELNHHLMEGLRNPALAKKYLNFLFIESDKYSERVKLRYPLTREVVEKQEIETSVYCLNSETKLEQIFEVLAYGSWVSFYLAMLYDIDPQVVPWVDYFKEKIA